MTQSEPLRVGLIGVAAGRTSLCASAYRAFPLENPVFREEGQIFCWQLRQMVPTWSQNFASASLLELTLWHAQVQCSIGAEKRGAEKGRKKKKRQIAGSGLAKKLLRVTTESPDESSAFIIDLTPDLTPDPS